MPATTPTAPDDLELSLLLGQAVAALDKARAEIVRLGRQIQRDADVFDWSPELISDLVLGDVIWFKEYSTGPEEVISLGNAGTDDEGHALVYLGTDKTLTDVPYRADFTVHTRHPRPAQMLRGERADTELVEAARAEMAEVV